MADVTGFFGDQEIFLNNAATEETLKQLVAGIGVLTAKTADATRTKREFERELEEFYKELKKAADEGRSLSESARKSREELDKNRTGLNENTEGLNNNTDAENENTEATEDNTTALAQASTVVGYLKQGLVGLLQVVSANVSAISGMGNSISGAVGALSQIPIAGEIFDPMFGPVAQVADDVYEQFTQVANVGATFSGNLNEMITAAGRAGMTIDQFNSVIEQNAQRLIFLGGTTEQGARTIARLGAAIRRNGTADELARLGFNTEQINAGFAQYTERLRRGGIDQRLTDQQLIQGTQRYLRNLSAISRLTGENVEAIQAERDQRMANAQFRILQRNLDAPGQTQLDTLLDIVPPGLREGLRDILATGAATTTAGEQIFQTLPGVAEEAQRLHASMRQSGTLTEGQSKRMYESMRTATQAFADSPLADTLARFAPEFEKLITSSFDLAERQGNLDDAQAEVEKSARGSADALDPAVFMTLRQNIAQLSTDMQRELLNSQIFAELRKAIENILPVQSEVAQDAFRLLGEYVNEFIAAIVTLSAALTGLAAHRIFTDIRNPRTSTTPTTTPVPGETPTPDRDRDPDRRPPDSDRDRDRNTPSRSRFSGLKFGVGGLAAALGLDFARDQVGEDTTAGKGIGVAQETITYAGLGAMFGSFVPGIGNVVGGALGGTFGLVKGTLDEFVNSDNQTQSSVDALISKIDTVLPAQTASSTTSKPSQEEVVDERADRLVNQQASFALENIRNSTGLLSSVSIDDLSISKLDEIQKQIENAMKPGQRTSTGTSRAQLLADVDTLRQALTSKQDTVKNPTIDTPVEPEIGAVKNPTITTPLTADLQQSQQVSENNSTADTNTNTSVQPVETAANINSQNQDFGQNSTAALNSNISTLISLMRENNRYQSQINSGIDGLSGNVFRSVG